MVVEIYGPLIGMENWEEGVSVVRICFSRDNCDILCSNRQIRMQSQEVLIRIRGYPTNSIMYFKAPHYNLILYLSLLKKSEEL